jgi:Tfp pilus assembly protein FimV
LTLAIRPIFLASVLAFGLAAAPSSQASLVNLEGLKSSFTYTPIAGESLDRIIAKTMPNSEVKPELMAEAFKALNPLKFSRDSKAVTYSNAVLKVPNQNQLLNIVEVQLANKSNQNSTKIAQAPLDVKAAELKNQAKRMLVGTKPTTPKINPKTESWVRFPSITTALSKKTESWVKYPNSASIDLASSNEIKTWVRYLGANVKQVTSEENTGTPKDEWVRYPSVHVQNERLEIGKLTLASAN